MDNDRDEPITYYCNNCKQLITENRSMPVYYCEECGSKDIEIIMEGRE